MAKQISPHLRQNKSTAIIMRDVLIALLPAAAGAVYFFGIRALLLMVFSIFFCVMAEFLYEKAVGKQVTTGDLSAAITGLLLAFTLPPTTPIWALLLADLFAIIVVKQMFGGMGSNVLNPALMGRLFLMVLYPIQLMQFTVPVGADTVSSATILTTLKASGVSDYSLFEAFFGRVPGAIGETSVLLLLIGFIFLVIRGEVNVVVSIAFFAAFAVIMGIFKTDVPMQLCSGGVVLGGCFMLTDYNLTGKSGKFLYGVLAGAVLAAIRLWTPYADGACYAILAVNLAAPIIDRLFRKRVYGT